MSADTSVKTGLVIGSFDFKETPSMQRLDQFLEDMFAQCNADIEYLFLAEQDHEALARQIRENTNIRCLPEYVPMMIDDLKKHYVNQSTGKLMNMATLSFLEPNHVVFVFSR